MEISTEKKAQICPPPCPWLYCIYPVLKIYVSNKLYYTILKWYQLSISTSKCNRLITSWQAIVPTRQFSTIWYIFRSSPIKPQLPGGIKYCKFTRRSSMKGDDIISKWSHFNKVTFNYYQKQQSKTWCNDSYLGAKIWCILSSWTVHCMLWQFVTN